MAMQYIGARYVPIFYTNPDDGSASWKANVDYESFTIVVEDGDSYTSKKAVPRGIGKPSENPKYWVKTGDFNASLLALQSRVGTLEGTTGELVDDVDNLETVTGNLDDDINDESTGLKVKVSNLETDVAKNTKNILEAPKYLHGNLILDDCFDIGVQGAAYVGNNKVVAYYAYSDNDTGVLKCFDIVNHTLEWSYSIKGYHGNAVTYNPNDNCVYITGCYYANGGAHNFNNNIIVVVNLEHPSVVDREIELPSTATCYAACYDATLRKFYVIPNTGVVEGTANLLYVYNEELTVLERTVILKTYPATTWKVSGQGCQYADNGIVYTLGYDESMRAIVGSKVSDGETVTVAMLPDIINKCRMIGEPEAIIYDFDNDNFMVASTLYNCGTYDKVAAMFFEIDLYKNIAEYEPVYYNGYYQSEFTSQTPYAIVVNGASGYLPTWYTRAGVFRYMMDALTFSKRNGACAIATWTSSDNLAEVSREFSRLDLSGFHGRIDGDASNPPLIHGVVSTGDCKAQFLRVKFVGVSPSFDGTWAGNVVVDNTSEMYFQACTFADFDSSAATTAHIICTRFSRVNIMPGCTFEGTKRAVRHTFNSSINGTQQGYVQTTRQNFNATANTYVYTGLSFEVPDGQWVTAWVRQNYSSGTPKGIKICKSSSSDVISELTSEVSDGLLYGTPMISLPAGTYYVWAKKAENTSGETEFVDLYTIPQYYNFS